MENRFNQTLIPESKLGACPRRGPADCGWRLRTAGGGGPLNDGSREGLPIRKLNLHELRSRCACCQVGPRLGSWQEHPLGLGATPTTALPTTCFCEKFNWHRTATACFPVTSGCCCAC